MKTYIVAGLVVQAIVWCLLAGSYCDEDENVFIGSFALTILNILLILAVCV